MWEKKWRRGLKSKDLKREKETRGKGCGVNDHRCVKQNLKRVEEEKPFRVKNSIKWSTQVVERWREDIVRNRMYLDFNAPNIQNDI